MKQREVTDANNTRWTCVQVYAGLDGKVSEAVADKAEDEEGKVTVVCTPTGGAQTVRLQLQQDWENKLTDEDLAAEITKLCN